jgi:hypothetical protein
MKKLGIHDVYCLSVNDAFVMRQVTLLLHKNHQRYHTIIENRMLCFGWIVGTAPGPGGGEDRRFQPPEPRQLQERQALARRRLPVHTRNGYELHLGQRAWLWRAFLALQCGDQRHEAGEVIRRGKFTFSSVTVVRLHSLLPQAYHTTFAKFDV